MNIRFSLLPLLCLAGTAWAGFVPLDPDTYYHEQLDAMQPLPSEDGADAEAEDNGVRVTTVADSPYCVSVVSVTPGSLQLAVCPTAMQAAFSGTPAAFSAAVRNRISLYKMVYRALPCLSCVNKGEVLQGLVCYLQRASASKQVVLNAAEAKLAVDFAALCEKDGILNFHALLLAEKQLSVQENKLFLRRDELAARLKQSSDQTSALQRQMISCKEQEQTLMSQLETLVKRPKDVKSVQTAQELAQDYLKRKEDYEKMVATLLPSAAPGELELLRFDHKRFLQLLRTAEKTDSFNNTDAGKLLHDLGGMLPVPYHLGGNLLTPGKSYVTVLSQQFSVTERWHDVSSALETVATAEAVTKGTTACSVTYRGYFVGKGEKIGYGFRDKELTVNVRKDLLPDQRGMTTAHELNHFELMKRHPEFCMPSDLARTIKEASALVSEMKWRMDNKKETLEQAWKAVISEHGPATIAGMGGLTYVQNLINVFGENPPEKWKDLEKMRTEKIKAAKLELSKMIKEELLKRAKDKDPKHPKWEVPRDQSQQKDMEIIKHYEDSSVKKKKKQKEVNAAPDNNVTYTRYDDNLVYAGEGTADWAMKYNRKLYPILKAITDKNSADYYAESVAKLNRALVAGFDKSREDKVEANIGLLKQEASIIDEILKVKSEFARIERNNFYGSAKLRAAYSK